MVRHRPERHPEHLPAQVIFCVQGVISPLLAKVYLHWFDKLFYRANGPAGWAKAKLVRYADDFVVLARYQGPALQAWIEEKIEKWLGLEINRDKTRVVDLIKGTEGESGLSGLHSGLPAGGVPEYQLASRLPAG